MCRSRRSTQGSECALPLLAAVTSQLTHTWQQGCENCGPLLKQVLPWHATKDHRHVSSCSLMDLKSALMDLKDLPSSLWGWGTGPQPHNLSPLVYQNCTLLWGTAGPGAKGSKGRDLSWRSFAAAVQRQRWLWVFSRTSQKKGVEVP